MLVIAAVGLGAASVAWACSDPAYGTPTDTPFAPATQGTAATVAPTATPAPAAAVTGKVTGSSTVRSSAHATAPAPSKQRASAGVAPSAVHSPSSSSAVNSSAATSGASAYGSGALVARRSGATAGVTSQGGQSVFRSSVAAPRAKARPAHRSHARTHAAVHAAAPSQLSASGDVWSGFASPAKSFPVAGAAAGSAGHGGGLSSQMLVGIVILGVGLTGLFGGSLAVASRRRRSAGSRRVDAGR
ncbi:MAG TPA: hypothetical protein VG275_00305 [Solirubrobacteraceae bacterium]|jgi:hypothetical protein|nr:hypothetical protein [Solirubrobacteraceae bacterium]